MCVAFTLMFAENESLEDKLQKFGQDSAEGFIKPVINGLSGDLNSGFYNTAKVLKPFRFQLTVSAMATMVPDEDKTFKMKNPFLGELVNPYVEDEIETATIFGKDGGVFHSAFAGGDSLVLPDGLDIPTMPLMAPQFALGLPFGTEVQVRYLPKYDVGNDIGEVQYFGVGLKHSVSQYLPLFPVDIAVQGFYQSFTLGDLIDIKAKAANVQVSKKLLFLTFYGGLGWESTNFKAEYTFEKQNPIPGGAPIPIPVKLDIDADNSVKATVGMRVSLLFLKLYGDYSFGKCNTACAGLGLGF